MSGIATARALAGSALRACGRRGRRAAASSGRRTRSSSPRSTLGYLAVGRKDRVSDNAIRKWRRAYEGEAKSTGGGV
jgi:hypothetical protein